MTSNIYGQVATAAIEEQIGINPSDIFDEYFSKFLYKNGNYWLSDEKISRLRKRAKEIFNSRGRVLSSDEMPTIIEGIPSDGHVLAERVIELAEKSAIARKNSSARKKTHFANEILSDPIIKRIAGI